ncbi:MAG: T9SS type A sorting domain-containing protein [Aureispira sp.]|nr:T9SS type A sorting domain-containing protein [Aureispira sp.]
MNRLTFICLLLAPYFLGAQTSTWEHYKNNLEINDVLIHQNHLWIATDDGLYSMDKTSSQVQHYTPSNSSLPDLHVQTLSNDAAGNIWIGTYDLALVKIPANGANWDVINYPSASSFTNVYCSKIDATGNIWMGTNSGLMHYDGNQWQTHPITSGAVPVWDIEITSTGKIFAGSFNLFSFENGVWTELVDSNQTHSFLTYNDHDLYLENDNTLWLLPAGNPEGILRYQNQTWQSWSFNNGSLPINPKFEDVKLALNQAGQLSYNTNSNKLVYYDGSSWQIDSSIQHQAVQNIGFQNFVNDNNGNLWAFDNNTIIQQNAQGTSTHQITTLQNFSGYEQLIPDNLGNMLLLSRYSSIPSKKIENGNWSNFSISTPNGNIETFNHAAFDANNYLWASVTQGSTGNKSTAIVQQTATGTLIHDNASSGGVLPLYNQQSNYIGAFGTILISSTGTVWVQYGPNQIFQYKNGVWSQINISASNVMIEELQVDNLDNLWWLDHVTTYQGGQYTHNRQLKKYNGTSIQTINTPSALTNSSLYPLHIDDNGQVWLAPSSLNTISKFDGTNWSSITLPSSLNNNNLYPRDIKSNNGKVYIATSFGGIFSFDGQTWSNTTTSNSDLSIENITKITFDKKGDLWIQDYYYQLLDIWQLGSSVTTSITNIGNSSKLQLSIYPNPTTAVLNLEHVDQDIQMIKILNNQGQLVKSVIPSTKNIQISVDQLPAGNYWINAISDKKQYTQPFVKH